LDRAFDVVASPSWLGASLALLSGVHLADAFRLSNHAIGWSTEPARAIVVALVAVSALAAAVTRILPLIQGAGSRAASGALQPDAVFARRSVSSSALNSLDRNDSRFQGRLVGVGVVLLFAGLIAYGAWPLWQSPGLGSGAELVLDVGETTEAATVEVEGVSVDAHLAGSRYELVAFEPGRASEHATGVANATLRMTEIATRNVYEATAWDGAPARLGDYEFYLAGAKPSTRVSGVAVTITEVATGRTFDADLSMGSVFQDPAGPGKFKLEKIEENILEGHGAAAMGTVAVGAVSSEFWVYVDSPDFDAKHGKGLYTVKFRHLSRGDSAVFRLGALEPNTPVPIALVAMLAGFLLLFSGPQRTVVLRAGGDELEGDDDDEVAISSLNDGESVIRWIDDSVFAEPDDDDLWEEDN
jgi:hypothetical protein